MKKRGGDRSATTAGRGWAAGVLRAAGLRGSSRPGRDEAPSIDVDALIDLADATSRVENWTATTPRQRHRVAAKDAERLVEAGIARVVERD